MNTKLILAAACILITAAVPASAQKIKSLSGDVKPVLTEKQINVQYDYSNMMVGKGMTEEEYIAKKVAEGNKDEAGKGDKWKESWTGSRGTKYQPKFEELLNEHTKDLGMKHGAFPNAKYTLIVKTTFTEPGYNVGVMKQPSFINLEYTYVETANPATEVARLSLDKVPGSQAMGFDYDAGTRISESYAKGGKVLGKYLADQK